MAPLKSWNPGLGRVRIRALDAGTRLGIASFRVRAANTERLADRSSDPATGEVELKLTAGPYSLLVLCPGYEPAEVTPVQVDDRSSTDLGWVPLSPGSGRIVGRVLGELPGEATIFAELRGGSRRPCTRCSTPYEEFCGSCGFAESSSRLALFADGRFEFRNLASGAYTVFLTDDGDRIFSAPANLELRAGESLALPIEFLGIRDLRIELFDSDGSSLAGEWEARRRIAASFAAEGDDLGRPSPLLQFEGSIRTGELPLAQLTWNAPSRRPGSGRFSSRRLGCGSIGCFGPRASVDDRPRCPDEPLRPRLEAPGVDAPLLSLEVGLDGRVLVERIPASALTVDLSCGPLTARAVVPAARGETRVLAALSTPDGSTLRAYEARLDSSD